jgi:hypothetical protein
LPGRFWNEAIETLSPPDVRRLENERLAEQIAYNYASSPYYRAKLDSAGVKPDAIRGREDLARVPFMEKTEVADSQADGTLLGVNQCAPLERIVPPSSPPSPPTLRPLTGLASAQRRAPFSLPGLPDRDRQLAVPELDRRSAGKVGHKERIELLSPKVEPGLLEQVFGPPRV